MRRLKKFAAGFMCLCMIVTTNGFTALASESNRQESGQESSIAEQQTDDMSELATDSDSKEQDQETEAEIETEAETEEEADVETEALLNYIVVGSDYIETPDSQYVLADVGTPDSEISSAVMHYINRTTGTAYDKTVDVISGTAVLFNLEFQDAETQSGVYEITGIDYVVNGVAYSVDMKSVGMLAVFGVNEKADANPDAWIVDETAEQEASGVLVTDISSGETVGAQQLAETIADASAGMPVQYSDDGQMIIVLDAGHGGGDSGTWNTIDGIPYYEKDITLKIAKYCKELLEKYPDVAVYMTREGDTNPDLADRVAYAKRVDADILISLHINSGGAAATGAEVLIPNSSYNEEIHKETDELGKVILAKLAELGLRNRGNVIKNSQADYVGDVVKYYPDGSIGDYYYLNHFSKLNGFPGIIIEHAFLSNPDEARKYLTSDAMLKKLAQADVDAIVGYYGLSTEGSGRKYTIYEGVNYSAVYDYDYYISHNKDVAAAYGGDTYKTLRHFVLFGMKEGRQGNEEFDVTSYRYKYADLRKSYRMNLEKYYMHYIKNGKKENRQATGVTKLQNATTVYNGVDYSAVYDYDYYMSKYPEVKKVYGYDDLAALKYFVTSGMLEGQQASENFDVYSYRNRYADLRKTFGTDLTKYYMHYINFGKKEGRKATGDVPMQGASTVYNGVDYSAVYDFNYYISKYADIKRVYGNDENGALRHFVLFGMKEGRQAKESFDVTSYRYQYADLRKAFGTDLPKYYMHYVNNGAKEGRKATGVTSIQNATTVYNGVDYSAVYDYYYYIEKYKDLKKAYENDENAAIKHFVEAGMSEGRQANEIFDVKYYRANNADLERAYGDNLKSYYRHYMNFGKNEGRKGNANDPAKPVNPNLYAIMGNTSVTADQMVRYYNSVATYPEYYADSDAPTIEDFCNLYIEECKAEGVKAEVAFAQAMMETGYLRFGGSVQISQFNFAGIGATDSGGASATFSTVREGIRAQVQHLKAYASKEPLKNACVDPRFGLVTRGSAQYVEWLGIQENPNGKGWATAERYGYNMRDLYIAAIKRY